MARRLELLFEGQSFRRGIEKVDCAASYGTAEPESRDKAGSCCRIATLAGDDRTIIPSGGRALACMARDA